MLKIFLSLVERNEKNLLACAKKIFWGGATSYLDFPMVFILVHICNFSHVLLGKVKSMPGPYHCFLTTPGPCCCSLTTPRPCCLFSNYTTDDRKCTGAYVSLFSNNNTVGLYIITIINQNSSLKSSVLLDRRKRTTHTMIIITN